MELVVLFIQRAILGLFLIMLHHVLIYFSGSSVFIEANALCLETIRLSQQLHE